MLAMRLAWRNTLRNRRRTLLTALVIGVGMAALMFVNGLVEGMKISMIRSATQTLLGEAQVHAQGYRLEPDVDLWIPQSDQVIQAIRKVPEVEAYSPRTLAQGMLSSAANVSAVQIYGVESELESRISLLKKALKEGQFLSGQEQEILIGSELARDLEVGLGDRMVLTVSQSIAEGKGELSQDLFRVSGIFDLQSKSMNRGVVVVNRASLEKALQLKNRVHEIALRFKDPQYAVNPVARAGLWSEVALTGAVIEDWSELMPALNGMIEMSRASTAIMAFILFAVISVGVVNSLLMSLYERMYEFGVLRAIGTRPWGVARMIFMESLCLGAIALVLGGFLGTLLLLWFGKHGIPMPSSEYAGTVLREPIKPLMSIFQYTALPISVLFLTFLAGLYPARVAARLNPSQAMRRSL
jgi:ABC-type lipoprotein release transport system permease subunit